jgi:uncharacterized coiled-coil protein SlyX
VVQFAVCSTKDAATRRSRPLDRLKEAMPRLRIRMELNRGGIGVPLYKMASVIDEAQKFFRMLAEDVRIGKDSGEWLGFDFDNKSLNFTAEYVGPVKPEQIREFYAAFAGETLLRQATIAQFARIAGAIDEDELIGFGLYQNDRETEPSEWRSLSKRDALRIAEEIRVLLDRTGDGESRLPPALDTKAAAALFRQRREHGGLAERVSRLENEMSWQSEAIQNLRGTAANTEQNLEKLLVTVDSFCDRATRQMERLPAPAQPAPEPPPPEPARFRWRLPVAIAAVCALAGVGLFRGLVGPRPTSGRVRAADPAVVTQPPAPAPETPKAPEPAKSVRVAIKASEPTWVAVYEDNKLTLAKLLDTDQTTNIDSTGTVRVRLGNAGGAEITANGKSLGRVGQKGQVKTIEFTPAGFRMVSNVSTSKQ